MTTQEKLSKALRAAKLPAKTKAIIKASINLNGAKCSFSAAAKTQAAIHKFLSDFRNENLDFTFLLSGVSGKWFDLQFTIFEPSKGLEMADFSIFNLTPHDITILNNSGQITQIIPPSGDVARLSVKTVADMPLGKIRTTKTVFGDVVGLPDFKENVFFVVSQLVKNAMPQRTDLLVPAEVLRDTDGNIIGCKSLGR
jgi:hypothetical protein